MTEPDRRPDPELLLRRVGSEEERASRPKFKVFLGYAPGVGKTYKMLQLARELLFHEVDMAVGAIETHGRYDTGALVLGMEVVPRRSLLYRGIRLEEFDLEAALARKPEVLLLDELAHTNAPGGRHARRWQDALDLLDAGISVHTTVNVQHVESLNDVVARITGVRVRETVPDSVLERADEIELVDCPPEELLGRLAEGKVYLPGQTVRTVEHLFERGNLLALRELSLRKVAEHADADVLEYREQHEVQATWPTAERLMVCVGPSPASARLIRETCRIAGRSHSPWIAAYVDSGDLATLPESDRARLESNLHLAESLGGEIRRLGGARVGQAVLAFARRHNVARIVLGKPTHSRLRDLVRGSLLEEIVRGSGDIDVLVISGTEEERRAREEGRSHPFDRVGYGLTLVAVAAGTAGGLLARAHVSLPDLVMIYLLVIILVAVRWGRGPSILAAALAVAAYDYFFVPPIHTFSIDDVRHLLTFAMMFGVGFLISGLTARLRAQERAARQREARTAGLYALSRGLGSALDEEQAALVLAEHAAEAFECGAAVLVPRGPTGLAPVARGGPDVPLDPPSASVARWAFDHRRPAGPGTESLPGARITCVPLLSGPEPLGVLALALPRPLDVEGRSFLEALARQAALSLERARLGEEAKAAALRARAEEMRSAVLSSVSHDLRTPLAAITGAGTTLRDGKPGIDAGRERALLETICEEAERLERLIANLLSMTRLDSGAVEVKREWVPLEEVVGAALTRLEPMLQGRPVRTALPPELPLLPVDPVLLEQVFLNLLENAAKYTPEGAAIEVSARSAGGRVEIEVEDRGPGVPEGLEDRIFEKFFRAHRGRASGVGLGLSICRGIVEAHGGRIGAANRPDGGATFRIELPVLGTPPSVPAEEAEDG